MPDKLTERLKEQKKGWLPENIRDKNFLLTATVSPHYSALEKALVVELSGLLDTVERLLAKNENMERALRVIAVHTDIGQARKMASKALAKAALGEKEGKC